MRCTDIHTWYNTLKHGMQCGEKLDHLTAEPAQLGHSSVLLATLPILCKPEEMD